MTDYSPLRKRDTSNITNMRTAFQDNFSLKTLSGIEKWDTSSVETMHGMFFVSKELIDMGKKGKLSDLSALKDWNTSNVKVMTGMFQALQIENLESLKSWDVSKVETFECMFSACTNLSDASAINDWNISNNANFHAMFSKAPSHPEFSKIDGTWGDANTFIPN